MKLPSPILDIQGKKIGNDYATYFVADVAANHDGDLERAKDLIYLAAEAGADAVKFQHFDAETIVSDFGFQVMKEKQSHQAKWKKSVFEVYKDASVSMEWTSTLRDACDQAGIPFFTTPYSLDIVDEIDKFVPAYKIGSGDITWLQMIEKVAIKQKPYMLATGASTADEVHLAVKTALSINPMLSLMQCNTNYTASLENFKYIQLNVLKTYRNMYPGMVLGLSDHTPGHATVLGAVTLGASIIEKHFTDDTNRTGPDHKFSMDPISWREMVERTRELEAALGSGVKSLENNEIDTVVVQRRSLRANAPFNKGHIISIGDFSVLRPCPRDAIQISELKNVIGKSLNRDLGQDDHLKIGDVN
jgi:sialic acid synthase SpsE